MGEVHDRSPNIALYLIDYVKISFFYIMARKVRGASVYTIDRNRGNKATGHLCHPTERGTWGAGQLEGQGEEHVWVKLSSTALNLLAISGCGAQIIEIMEQSDRFCALHTKPNQWVFSSRAKIGNIRVIVGLSRKISKINNWKGVFYSQYILVTFIVLFMGGDGGGLAGQTCSKSSLKWK